MKLRRIVSKWKRHNGEMKGEREADRQTDRQSREHICLNDKNTARVVRFTQH